MDSSLLRRLLRQLKTRVRACERSSMPMFPDACRDLVKWVESRPFLQALLAPLSSRIASYTLKLRNTNPVGYIRPKDYEAPVALAWATLKYVATSEEPFPNHVRRLGRRVARTGVHTPFSQAIPADSHVFAQLKSATIPSVHDYLREQVEERNAVIGLLRKYKTRCEWYRRDRLRSAAAEGLEGRRSERALAFDLYEYLYDQGVDFAIESATASGEPDLTSSDAGGQPLVADAKYITDDSKVRETMAAGFRQVLRYCQDKNEATGYLVVFLNCEVRPEIEDDADDGFPCFRLGGVTVYYVLIDIRERKNTASKLPKPRVVPIHRDRLVEMIEAPAGDPEPDP